MDPKYAEGMNCPRCSGPVAVSSTTVPLFGAIGAIVSMLTTTYACPKCGPIPFGEFPAEVRTRVRSEMIIGIVIFLAVLGLLIGLLIWLRWG